MRSLLFYGLQGWPTSALGTNKVYVSNMKAYDNA